MEITNIKFSVAKSHVKVGEDAAFFSIELDDAIIMHRFTLKKVKNGYRLCFPTFKVDSKDKSRRIESRPIVFIENKELKKMIEEVAIDKFNELIEEYKGLYVFKKHGAHN